MSFAPLLIETVVTERSTPHLPTKRASRKMLAELLKLAEQALQRGPALQINACTGVFVECQPMGLGVIDIKAHVNYTLFHRRLLGRMWFQKHSTSH